MAKKTVRKITANKKILLNQLAGLLCEFLPLSSNAKNTITFKTIFKESNVEQYVGKHNVKVQAIENGLTELYRRHIKLPKIIIRKIVPASIDYRLYKRKPLTIKEIEELSSILFRLGIDMRKELAEIEINESLPRIKVPPPELEKYLRNHDLDPNISSEPLQLFSDGHFNEAVRKASERLEDFVREVSNLSLSGRDLMANAFRDGTYINTLNIQPQNRQGFIDGFKLLNIGAMASIRNVFSHGDEESRSPEECFEMLMLINWLFRNIKILENSENSVN